MAVGAGSTACDVGIGLGVGNAVGVAVGLGVGDGVGVGVGVGVAVTVGVGVARRGGPGTPPLAHPPTSNRTTAAIIATLFIAWSDPTPLIVPL